MLIYGIPADFNSVGFYLYKANYEVNWIFQVYEKATIEDWEIVQKYGLYRDGVYLVDKQHIPCLFGVDNENRENELWTRLHEKLRFHSLHTKKDKFCLIIEKGY